MERDRTDPEDQQVARLSYACATLAGHLVQRNRTHRVFTERAQYKCLAQSIPSSSISISAAHSQPNLTDTRVLSNDTITDVGYWRGWDEPRKHKRAGACVARQ